MKQWQMAEEQRRLEAERGEIEAELEDWTKRASQRPPTTMRKYTPDD